MNEKLTTQDLTDLLAAKHGMTKKDAEAFVKEFFLLIEQALENDKNVKIKGLGTFKLVNVDSRESVNINTGERFEIKGHTKVSFLPDANLRDTINKPFAHFETVVLNENTVLEDTLVEEAGEEEDCLVDDETTEEFVEDGKDDTVNVNRANIEHVDKQTTDLDAAVVEENVAVEDVFPVDAGRSEACDTEGLDLEKTEKGGAATVSKPALQVDESVTTRQIRWGEHLTPAKEKSYMPYLTAVILLVLLLCGGAVLFVYYPDLFSNDVHEEETVLSAAADHQESLLADTIQRKDTALYAAVAVQDSVKKAVQQTVSTSIAQSNVRENQEPSAAPVVVKKKVEAAPKQEKKQPATVYSDSVTYKIVGTKTKHTVKAGETLTRVALRYYGTKAMWPYIVKHNKGIIKNPDNVPYGTTIRIPELVKE